MTYQQPTEVIGNSINAWDHFYHTHYEWVYKQSLEVCHNTLKAKELTDKLFVKIFFTNPEFVVKNDQFALRNELGILFPYAGVKTNQNKELSAGRLLHLYYQPN